MLYNIYNVRMCVREWIEVMRTKENYRGQSFEVTFDKEFEVVRPRYTFKFILKREENIDPMMMKLYSTDIRIQIATIGCVVLFTNLPRVERYSIIPYVSNAPLLEAVYKMIVNGECI